MARDWYYSQDGKQSGPIPSLELRTLARSGRLGEKDKVWCEGMPSWVEAGSVPGLHRPNAVSGPAKPAGEAGETLLPWGDEEPNAFNPRKWYGVGGAGCCFALAILFCLLAAAVKAGGPAAIGAWFGLLSIFVAMLSMPGFLGLKLRGRWIPTEDDLGWVEFLPGNTFRRENGSVGTYTLLKNHQFVDLTVSRGPSDRWKILSQGDKTLFVVGTMVIQDKTGLVRTFKKGKTTAEGGV